MTKPECGRSVLIFGGAGFIGSNFAYHLLTNTDARVHIFDNLSRPGVQHNLDTLNAVDPGRRRNGSPCLQFTYGDVRDRQSVERVILRAAPTEIYHFAAQVAVTTSLMDPRLDFDVNVQGTFNVLEGARRSGNRPFLLFTSTNKVYGEMADCLLQPGERRWSYADRVGVSECQPLDFHSPYGCSKGAADQYVHDYARIYGLPTVVFRMSCIAGPRQFGNEDQGWVAHFLYSAVTGKPLVIYGDGRQVRDILCVHDLVRAFDAAHNHIHQTAGNIYNVGGGPENSVSLLELMELVEQITGARFQFQDAPSRPGDQTIYVSDTAKIRRDTDWKPLYDVPRTLAVIYEWWRMNRDAVSGIQQLACRSNEALLLTTEPSLLAPVSVKAA